MEHFSERAFRVGVIELGFILQDFGEHSRKHSFALN